MRGQLTPKIIKELADVARKFRTAIEKCDRSLLPVSFQNFPNGACGDVTPLLGTYLIELGYQPFNYMLGEIGIEGADGWSSHAWLQLSDLVVDITADQFSEISSPVLVLRNSSWHKSLNGKFQHKADFRIFDGHTIKNLERAYNSIIAELNQ